MQKISPFLWFDNNAEEAVNFYASTFKNFKPGKPVRYTEAGAAASGRPKDSVMTVPFELEGIKITALNGGPIFKLNPAISFFVNCEDKEEVEQLWDKLSRGGKSLMPLDTYPFSEKYGWIEDKYGLSWQLFYSATPVDQKIVPSLLFVGDVAGRAEEAINFYTSIFQNSKRLGTFRYEANQLPDKEGTIAYADFLLQGQKFAAMDSAQAHNFTFNESISFVINCEDQEEIDHFWNKLAEGADEKAQQCGWMKDKYGVSWQIVPIELGRLLGDKDPMKSQKVMQAILGMKKLIVKDLQKAFNS
jgi:predicted 3-demethylubiquinone-9 3-methyltransferase (glyoxalase superfamily)